MKRINIWRLSNFLLLKTRPYIYRYSFRPFELRYKSNSIKDETKSKTILKSKTKKIHSPKSIKSKTTTQNESSLEPGNSKKMEDKIPTNVSQLSETVQLEIKRFSNYKIPKNKKVLSKNATFWEKCLNSYVNLTENSSNTLRKQNKDDIKRMSTSSEIISRRTLNHKITPFYIEQHITSCLDINLEFGKLDDVMELVINCFRDDIYLSADILNSILWKFAENAEMNRNHFDMIFKEMERRKIKNLDTYAAKLFFFIQNKDDKNVKLLLQNLIENRLDPKYILSTSDRISQKTINTFLEGLLKLVPNFTIERQTSDIPLGALTEQLYADIDSNQISSYQMQKSEIAEIMPKQKLLENLKIQIANEIANKIEIKSIIDPIKEKPTKKSEKFNIWNEMFSDWEEELKTIIKNALNFKNESITKSPNELKNNSGSYLFLKTHPVEYWTSLLLETIKDIIENHSQPLTIQTLTKQLSQRAYYSYVNNRKINDGYLNHLQDIYPKYVDFIIQSDQSMQQSPQKFWDSLIDPKKTSLNINYPEWTVKTQKIFGSTLLSFITIDLKLPKFSNQTFSTHDKPFYNVLNRKHQMYQVTPHQKLVQIYQSVKPNIQTVFRMPTPELPMLVPPKPWIGPFNGGFLLSNTSLIHFRNSSITNFLPKNIGDIGGILDAINYLSNCPWKINTNLFSLVKEIFEKGGDEELGVAIRPKKIQKPSPPSPTKTYYEVLDEYFQSKYNSQKQRDTFSLYMDMLYRLSTTDWIKHEIFWMPYFLDFRGRCYTIPHTVSHLSHDVHRGYLKFAIGKPLGPKGLDWLKIHAINLTGAFKKQSTRDRLTAANTHIEDIIDSAERPFEGRGWWRISDDPWQTLAACFEIRDAIKSGDPYNFISHLPVHQDGSCNGLQHFASLGLDVEGAKNVSLYPSDIPSDVYTEVAIKVEEFRAEDARNGEQIALDLEGLISRKVVKQSVMTECYGVTRFGARQQIQCQLEDITDWPNEKLFDASLYLVKLLFTSMHQMFSNAKKIQAWLTKCASHISKNKQSVEWITPMGLLCVQPYYKPIQTSVMTPLKRTNIIDTEPTRQVLGFKQRNAFSPNFVHSLDSCHMMLTALRCQKAGITFVAVHDSYWTHACTADEMGRMLREEFIRLHSQPILEDLSKYFIKIYGDNELFRNYPMRGDFDLKHVADSQYFFS